jgi:hypothetical protein
MKATSERRLKGVVSVFLIMSAGSFVMLAGLVLADAAIFFQEIFSGMAIGILVMALLVGILLIAKGNITVSSHYETNAAPFFFIVVITCSVAVTAKMSPYLLEFLYKVL